MIDKTVREMISILLITVIGGILFFHLSKNKANNKTYILNITTPKVDERALRTYTLITNI